MAPIKRAATDANTSGSLPEAASAVAIGDAIGLTARRVRQIAAERGILPAGRGHYPLASILRAVIEAARADRNSSPEGQARAELTRVRTREIELRTAEKKRELIPLDDANFAIDEVVGIIVGELIGLPRRLTRDPKLMRAYDDEVNETRRRIAEAVLKKARELRG